MKQLARSLRKNQTEAEKFMWTRLRNRQLSGYKFRRQHPIGPYIIDLFCPERGIVIEIDGGQHSQQVEYDNLRSDYLESRGYRVLRFWNNQIFGEIDAVLEEVFSCLEDNPPHPRIKYGAGSDPLPQVGKREEEYDGLVSQEADGTHIPQASMEKESKAGFTLIELIVALVLAAIMMVGALFIYRDFMDTWDQELSSIEMQRQGTYGLTVMEDMIKNSDSFSIGDYGGGTDNKLTVTVPTTAGGAKDVDYYHDDGVSPKELKEKDALLRTMIPDTHVEEIEVASLTFTEDTIVGRSVRIDLSLTDTYGQAADFTTSVRLRNENVE